MDKKNRSAKKLKGTHLKEIYESFNQMSTENLIKVDINELSALQIECYNIALEERTSSLIERASSLLRERASLLKKEISRLKRRK